MCDFGHGASVMVLAVLSSHCLHGWLPLKMCAFGRQDLNPCLLQCLVQVAVAKE